MASRLQDVIARGLASAKPLATTVAPGTLYYSSDTASLERSNGTVWESYTAASSGGIPGPHAVNHQLGGSDALALDQSQITGLAASLAAKADAIHAPTHALGGTDALSVLALTGYPGGTTDYLRADGSFAPPPTGGVPSSHASTHNFGGSDPITVTGLAGYPGGMTDFLRADGTFAPPAGGGTSRIVSIGLMISGGASVITTGIKGFIEVPFAGTIQAVTLLGEQIINAAIVIDIWKLPYASYPPNAINSITASAKPTIPLSQIKAQDTVLTGWNKTINAGDVLGFNVDSVTLFKYVTLSLKVLVP